MLTLSTLIVAPLFFSLITMMSSPRIRNIFVSLFVVVLGVVSVENIFFMEDIISFRFVEESHIIFMALDFIVLFYFLWQGVSLKNSFVIVLAIMQLLLYSYTISLSPMLVSSDILVDKISSVMYLIINVVGGIIVFYALEYIESENFTRVKKNGFIAMLFFFLAVMNFIVSTNNIEIFFLLFELTTLCSFVLIAYRRDEISIKNATKALWMNQIGGVAILIALIFSILQYDTIYLDKLIENINSAYLLPIVFLAIAGFVKGASIPFDKWLLGAMVAPTPVSAILHSATMVKIAPYLMLKLAPAMDGFISLSITLFGTFVFFTASFMALSKDYFKEILGYSTIALLALMMSIAAIGTQEAINVTLILIVFHAISKALLFLQAGILEKNFHLKYINDIDGLINYSPLVVFFILVGFASLTLPPFGFFIGKFMAIESIASEISNNPLYVIALIFIALGSTLLTLLYFKVLTKLFAKDEDSKQEHIQISKVYTISSYLLFVLLLIGIYISFLYGLLSFLEIIVPLLLFLLIPILLITFSFKNAHKVKEYNCGDKDEIKLNMYYFEIPKKIHLFIYIVSIVALFILVLGVTI